MIDPLELNRQWPDHLQPIPDLEEDDYGMADAVERERMLREEYASAMEEPVSESATWDDECLRFPWRKPIPGKDLFADRFSSPKILELDYADGQPSLIARLAKEVAWKIQFPENTAYLHGLGAFSSATVVNFQTELYSKVSTPTGLYTLGSQPSGSGKTGVNQYFMAPIHEALKYRARALDHVHRSIYKKLAKLDKDEEKETSDAVLREIVAQRHDLRDQLDQKPPVGNALKNTTPEAAAKVALRQHGVVNIVSDEAEAVNTYLDMSYKDTSKSKANNGMYLAAFDGEQLGESRVGRESMEGAVRGAFAVIAQHDVIETMIKAGETGRGVTERCLIIKERSMVGYRDHSEDREVDPALESQYSALCMSILNSQQKSGATLKVNQECKEMLRTLKQTLEPDISAGAKYGSEQIRGSAAKVAQQAIKIASNLHIAHHWSGKSPRYVMELEPRFLLKGINIAMAMLDSYKELVDAYSGDSSSRAAVDVATLLLGYAKKGDRHVFIKRIVSSVNRKEWYIRAENKNDFVLNLIKRCENLNFCMIRQVGGDKAKWPILVNPLLAEFNPLEQEK